ncbi:prepilin-type N-terminal cleavage/methylation domain-containing protein [Candidatus Curtissbacteria bacterium]|nr:prepilin-type N-terminal cleavage/methylation domain-containing protein [Candidatus Curtissbacteria bacterium]
MAVLSSAHLGGAHPRFAKALRGELVTPEVARFDSARRAEKTPRGWNFGKTNLLQFQALTSEKIYLILNLIRCYIRDLFSRGGEFGLMIIPAQKRLFRGFTLIELLIVIAILGILAAAVLVAVNPGKRQKQARDSARKSDIGQMATALQAYYTTPGQGVFPTAGSGCGAAVPGLTQLIGSGDLKQVPTGPTGDGYCYLTAGDATEASVYATLEDPTSGAGTFLFCWQSTTGKAKEITQGSCSP